MQIGALALGGLSLPEILAAKEASGTGDSDTSVIMLYQHGGASQLETYDLKADAPTSYRSVFNPIPTNVPGLNVCELFPLQAKMADRFSLVRSLHHDVGIHSDGGIVALTGKRPTVLAPTSQSKSEHPDFGSVTCAVNGFSEKVMPPYVAIPRAPYMTRPTYLGLHRSAYETGDPNSKSYQPPQVKLAVPSLPESSHHVLTFSLQQATDTAHAAECVESRCRWRSRCFIAVRSTGVCERSANSLGDSETLYLHLFVRRTIAARHVGSKAGRAGFDSGTVPAD